MHFDVVTGNPPYSDRTGVDGGGGGGCSKDLDDKFFIESMKISDYVSLIIRAKHFSKENSRFKKCYLNLAILCRLNISMKILSRVFRILPLALLPGTRNIKDHAK